MNWTSLDQTCSCGKHTAAIRKVAIGSGVALADIPPGWLVVRVNGAMVLFCSEVCALRDTPSAVQTTMRDNPDPTPRAPLSGH